MESTSSSPSSKWCSIWVSPNCGGDILLTAVGKSFADVDTDARKQLFAAPAAAYVPLAAHIKRVLDERPSHRAPRIRFEASSKTI